MDAARLNIIRTSMTPVVSRFGSTCFDMQYRNPPSDLTPRATYIGVLCSPVTMSSLATIHCSSPPTDLTPRPVSPVRFKCHTTASINSSIRSHQFNTNTSQHLSAIPTTFDARLAMVSESCPVDRQQRNTRPQIGCTPSSMSVICASSSSSSYSEIALVQHTPNKCSQEKGLMTMPRKLSTAFISLQSNPIVNGSSDETQGHTIPLISSTPRAACAAVSLSRSVMSTIAAANTSNATLVDANNRSEESLLAPFNVQNNATSLGLFRSNQEVFTGINEDAYSRDRPPEASASQTLSDIRIVNRSSNASLNVTGLLLV